MPRCENCNKFVSLDTEDDPEVDLDVDSSDGTVSGTVHIVNNCADCGSELRTADFDVEIDHSDVFGEHKKKADDDHRGDEPLKHELSIDIDHAERMSRTEGKGRGLTTFYGAEIAYWLTCSCKDTDEWTHEDTWADDIKASAMDEA